MSARHMAPSKCNNCDLKSDSVFWARCELWLCPDCDRIEQQKVKEMNNGTSEETPLIQNIWLNDLTSQTKDSLCEVFITELNQIYMYNANDIQET